MRQYSFLPDDVRSTLVDVLCWRAADRPEWRGYTFLADGETDEVHLTFGQLDRQARAIAARLQSLGVAAADQRVLLLYPPGLEYIAAFFGCLYAGVVAVPTYPPDVLRLERTLPRFLATVADAAPAAVLTTGNILSYAESLFEEVLAEEYPDLRKAHRLATDGIPDEQAEAWRRPVLSASSLAFLQYTSGSTAEPRGVMLTHGNLMHNLEIIRRSFGSGPDTRGVIWLPAYHDMGLIGGILQPLYCGGQVILMSPLHFLQRPLRWLQAISRGRGTHSGGPNFAYDLCVRKVTPQQRDTLDLSCWELAFNGAEPVRAETLERFAAYFAPCGFRREAFYPCYGLAEATLLVTGGFKAQPPALCQVQTAALARHRVTPAEVRPGATDLGREGVATLVSCGRAWLGERVIIVDPESRRPCLPERIGEIWVAGASVAQGYWNQPRVAGRTFHAYLVDSGEGPFLRTGDLGFLKGGELFVTSRLKDLIIIDGLNHYPQDIESTVEQSHPLVRPGGVAAFSLEVQGQERLVVAAEIGSGRPWIADPVAADAQAISTAIRRAVARRHDLRAHAVVLLKAGSLPKTSSGKIQRFACREGFVAGTLDLWEGATRPGVRQPDRA